MIRSRIAKNNGVASYLRVCVIGITSGLDRSLFCNVLIEIRNMFKKVSKKGLFYSEK
ncbi:hypothetical protein J2X69_003355 [Algoriphagus sp. 4150]|nr:hypothetical protein [Algoriphagus sp. 4150]